MDIGWFFVYWACCLFLIVLSVIKRDGDIDNAMTFVFVIFLSPLLPIIAVWFLFKKVLEKIR